MVKKIVSSAKQESVKPAQSVTPPASDLGMTAMLAEIAKLKAENEALKKKSVTSLKVTEKGGFSIYGLGRFPFTFYLSQYLKVKEMIPMIDAFIEANKDKLKMKGE